MSWAMNTRGTEILGEIPKFRANGYACIFYYKLIISTKAIGSGRQHRDPLAVILPDQFA